MFATVVTALGAPQRLSRCRRPRFPQPLRQHRVRPRRAKGRRRQDGARGAAEVRHHRRHARRPDRRALGLKEGETVVTSGQIKLRSGSVVVINNDIQPSNDAAPAARGRVKRATHEVHRHLHPAAGARGVVSLLILVLGLRAIFTLPMMQYPQHRERRRHRHHHLLRRRSRPGGGLHHQPLENAIAQAQRHRLHDLDQRHSVSTITATCGSTTIPNKALTEINTKVNSVLNQLPPGSQQPVLSA